MKKAVIVFQKSPIAGQVKTRLAADLGDEEALRVYCFLLDYTHQQLKKVVADIHVFIDGPSTSDLNRPKNYFYHTQQGADLGERMIKAFDAVFHLGYDQVLIIGTDCYELTSEDISQAFYKLNTSELVLGPAKDGGYYLLGLTAPCPDIFSGIHWSTSSVLQETVTIANYLNLPLSLLPTLSDIDTIHDLGELMVSLNISLKK